MSNVSTPASNKRSTDTTRWAAWLLAAQSAFVVGCAIVGQLLNDWNLPVHYARDFLAPAAGLLVASALMRRLRWAWWAAALVAGFWLTGDVLTLFALTAAEVPADLARAPSYLLQETYASAALLAAALLALVQPGTRAAFAPPAWLATPGEPASSDASAPASPVDPRDAQPGLAFALVLAAMFLTPERGHGSVTLWTLVSNDPIFALPVIVMAIVLVVAAFKTGPPGFALWCSLVAILTLYVFLQFWLDQYHWPMMISGIPFVAVWVAIVMRASIGLPPADGDAATPTTGSSSRTGSPGR